MKNQVITKINLIYSFHVAFIKIFLLAISLYFIIFDVANARATFYFAAKDYANQQYLDSETLQFINQKGYVRGTGAVDYRFYVTNSDAGWYELWIEAADWPTDIFLDDALIAHIALQSKVWTKSEKLQKVLNLNLGSGNHSIQFERLYFPGLPYIHSIVLKPSANISGMVRATPETNSLVFRANEDFRLTLTSAKLLDPSILKLSIRDTSNSKIITNLKQPIKKGPGLFEGGFLVPTDKEGIFDLEFKNPIAGYVDRTIQYAVVDTKTPVKNPATEVVKQLMTTINPVSTPPTYSSSHPTPSNAYLESGANGVYENPTNPDYYAYTLNLPDKTSFYLVEVDYPNDKNRAFTISLVDEAANPYALDSGVITGGRLPLTNEKQTTQLYFYARTTNPRLLFLNWHSNQKIAVSQIRVYKILSQLPPLLKQKAERQFGTFFEEPLRFTTYFGAGPNSTEWPEIKKTADRWAEWSRFIGSNLWMPSIANYQTMMWPSLVLPGYVPAEEDHFGLIGPQSLKDPMQKDIIRLLLLTAEKNNISFIGELNIPMEGFIQKGLDIRFGGNGDTSRNSPEKPWLIVSDEGKVGGNSGWDPYLNPVHPEVQKWSADLFSELANRYKDSPAFTGLAIRLMSWAFSSWQAFPSIHWGYEDYTISLFEKETGIKVPISKTDSRRFKLRYDWLTQNRYNEWTTWRCKKIHALYSKLANILHKARPGLKLYINAFGPDYSSGDWGKYGGWNIRAYKINTLGWSNVIKESGIDPMMYKNSPNIVLSNSFAYEPGSRATSPQQADVEWKEVNDPAAILALTKTNGNGIENSAQFGHYPMEYDFHVKNIGFSKLIRNNAEKIRIAGLLEPSGNLVLSRYLNAMAEGNITFITDGGLGYILGQPTHLQPFLKEYCSLPKIGMQKLAVTQSPVALWYGIKAGDVYYYLVNRSDKTVKIKITSSNATKSVRLSTGLAVDTSNLSLSPYSLIALKNTVVNSIPVKIDTILSH
jgi:hypothetical protein